MPHRRVDGGVDCWKGRPALMLARTRRVATGLAAVLAISSSAGVATAGVAGAAGITTKKKQAAALEAQIEANAVQLATLDERLKGVQDQLDTAQQTIDDAMNRIAAAQAETDHLEGLVRERAAIVYERATRGGDDSMFQLDVSTFASRERYAAAATEHDGQLLARLGAAQSDLAVVKHDAETAQHSAQADKNQLSAVKAEFDAAQGVRKQLLTQVQGDIKTLVAQDAAARRRAEAPPNFNPASLPPASGRGAIVVAYAKAQIGKPYKYAGLGPESFDCSGLTKMAWAQVGVSLPHNSEAQFHDFPQVPMNKLAAGDVVWRPGHVGIYVGGGVVIDAPHTGAVVRYMTVSYYRGAVRPG